MGKKRPYELGKLSRICMDLVKRGRKEQDTETYFGLTKLYSAEIVIEISVLCAGNPA